MQSRPDPDRGQHPTGRPNPTAGSRSGGAGESARDALAGAAPPGAARGGPRFSLLGLLVGVGVLGALAAVARRLIQASDGPAETGQLTFIGWVIFVPLVPALALLAAVGWYEFSCWRRRAAGRKHPRD